MSDWKLVDTVSANPIKAWERIKLLEAECKQWEELYSRRLDNITELEAEADELHKLITRLNDLLTDTANALKGEPDELTLHGFHDLPEIAARLREALLRTPDQAVARKALEETDE
ncbi:MAG: hypothetical protein DRR42_09900 [Gammaproteobacteria bacterium]|nr:MAG: hypothetical protein DRR42_09900 [Gammaproteobacteria bacterium]